MYRLVKRDQLWNWLKVFFVSKKLAGLEAARTCLRRNVCEGLFVGEGWSLEGGSRAIHLRCSLSIRRAKTYLTR